MTLKICHPKLPSCEDCKVYRYDDEWNLKKRRRGRVGLTVIEEPERRGEGDLPPCKTCPKIPSGVAPIPENAVVLSPENESAFFYYRLCREDPGGQWYERDGLTVQNNALIRGRLEAIDRQQANNTKEILLSLAKVQSP